MHDFDIAKQSERAFIDAFRSELIQFKGSRAFVRVETELSCFNIHFPDGLESISSSLLAITKDVLENLKLLNFLVTTTGIGSKDINLCLAFIDISEDRIRLMFADRSQNAQIGFGFFKSEDGGWEIDKDDISL